MEASALRAPHLARRPLTAPLLRLRSDEQLVSLFRAGSDEAFTTIHDRYRQRLFAYVRQMLSSGSRADAEDVLQDVFVRAYGALRADGREVTLRAWLYRVAHNRCIDQLRRPVPPAAGIYEMSRRPLQDPIELAQRREDLRRLVSDVGRLPEQQRSALLMREIDGIAYVDIAAALDVTVPAVKSLLVRARTGLVEAIEAREIDCSVIREDLVGAYDRGVKASGRARRHLGECADCRAHRSALRDLRRSFASLSPVVGFAPLALIAKVAGVGGGAAGVGGGATAGTVTACKVAAVMCGAALAGGTVVEVRDRIADRPAAAGAASAPVPQAPSATPPVIAAAPLRRPVDTAVTAPAAQTPGERASRKTAAPTVERVAVAPVTEAPDVAPAPAPSAPRDPVERVTGGSSAPQPGTAIVPATPAEPEVPEVPVPAATQEPLPTDPAATATPPPGGPPPEH